MQNGIGKIAGNELVSAAVNAVFAAAIFALAGAVGTTGFDVFSADWGAILKMAVNAGFAAFVGSVARKLSSTNDGAVFGAIPIGKK